MHTKMNENRRETKRIFSVALALAAKSSKRSELETIYLYIRNYANPPQTCLRWRLVRPESYHVVASLYFHLVSLSLSRAAAPDTLRLLLALRFRSSVRDYELMLHDTRCVFFFVTRLVIHCCTTNKIATVVIRITERFLMFKLLRVLIQRVTEKQKIQTVWIILFQKTSSSSAILAVLVTIKKKVFRLRSYKKLACIKNFFLFLHDLEVTFESQGNINKRRGSV